MTLYLNELGNLGHIGNQMFQYASLQGIAAHRGFDWAVPSKTSFGVNYGLRSNIYDCFVLDPHIRDHIGTGGENVPENRHGFDPELYFNIPDNSNISGYLQSFRYFWPIKHKIIKDFTFHADIVSRGFMSAPETSIHVRRTDYTALQQYHTNLPENYYRAAMEMVPLNNVKVFSDDPDWCMQQDVFKGLPVSESRDPYIDLYWMSQAKYHVIANSSFSWWGAVLSKSKNVVAPRNWFGPLLSHHDTSGYYLHDWTVI